MALKIGSLFVSLTANTDGFAKSMGKALKDVEKFSREVKKAANDAAQVAGSITALGAAALKLGADVSGPAKAAMTEFQASIKQAAAPVAEALVPAVREAAGIIRGLGKTFAELSPETKATVAEVFKVAAAVTAASLVIGRLAALVQLAAGVMSGLAGAIAAVGTGPLLAVLAVVAALAAGVAVLHKAWRENWGGIQRVVGKVAQWFADTWDGALNFVRDAFSGFVDALAGMAKASLGILAKLADATGTGAGPAIRASMNVVDQMAKDMKSGASVKKFMVAALDLGKQGANAFMEEWKLILAELGVDFAKFAAAVQKRFSGTALTVGGPKVRYEDLGYGEYDASSAGIAGGEQMDPRGMVGLPPSKVRKGALGGTSAAVASKEAIEQADAAKEASEAMKSSLANTATTFVGKLGEAGGIINTAISAASQGGPWAAVAAVLAELLSKTEAFVGVMDIAAGGLKTVTDALEPAATTLFNALGQVLAPAFQVIAVAVTAISPILESVAQVLQMVAPIIMLLVPVVRSLQPLLQFVADVLKAVFSALEPVFRVIFFVVQGIMIFVTAVQLAIVTIWNGLLEAIATVVDAVVALFTAGIKTNGGDFVRAGKGSVSALQTSMAELTTINYDSAAAAAAAAAANLGAAGAGDKLKDTVDAVNESFLNIPSGFKVAAARFNADASGYSPASSGSGGVNIGQVVIYANDSEDAMNQLERMMVRRTFRSTGSPIADRALAISTGAGR